MIRRWIKLLKENTLLRSGVIFFVSTMLVNVGNYIFQTQMGRFLTKESYGELGALMSIFYLFSVFGGTLQNAVVRYVATYKAENNMARLQNVWRYLMRLMFGLGVVVFVLNIGASGWIADYLKISNRLPLLFLDFMFVIMFAASLNRAVLQGLQRFLALSINLVIEVVVKLGVGLALVFWGWSLNGAVAGVIVGGGVAFIATLIPLQFLRSTGTRQEVRITRHHVEFSAHVFLITLCLTALYNFDLLLVKHYFTPELAGDYTTLSYLGRIIFFATGVIAMVVYPMVSERRAQRQAHRHLLIQSFLLVGVASTFGVLFYFLFPTLVIDLFYSEKYFTVAPYLGWVALVMGVYSLINLLVMYLMGIHRFQFLPVLVAGTFAEVVLIVLFHDTLMQVLWSLLGVMIFILLGSIAAVYLTRRAAPSLS
ncbi:MAG: oligosaccharide flippase family protein [Patescibacteria group bacterium]